MNEKQNLILHDSRRLVKNKTKTKVH